MKKNTILTSYLIFSLFISIMAPMVIDIMGPSLPYIAASLDLVKSSAQLIISIAIFGLVCGHVIAGTLSDVIGRARMIYIGLSILAIASFLCALADSFYLILLARFFQGMAASLIGANNRALIRERYDDNEYGSAINYVMFAWRTFVVIGPMVGAAIQNFISWKAVFYFNFFYAFVVLLVYIRFIKNKIQPIPGKNIRKNCLHFIDFFKNKKFILNIVALGLSTSTGILFVQFSPFFLVRHFHVSSLSIGLCNMSIGIAYIFSTFAIQYLQKKAVQIYALSLICLCIGFVLLPSVSSHSLSLFILSILTIQFGMGLSGPIILTNALQDFKDKASSAAAAQGMILWATCAGVSLFFGLSDIQSIDVYTVIMAIISFIVLAIWAQPLFFSPNNSTKVVSS